MRVRGGSSHPKRLILYVDIPHHSSSSRKNVTMADPDNRASTSSNSKRKRTDHDRLPPKRSSRSKPEADPTRKNQRECRLKDPKGNTIVVFRRSKDEWFCHCSSEPSPHLFSNPPALRVHYARAKKRDNKLEWNVSTFLVTSHLCA